MTLPQNQASKIYREVIDDVINSVREAFADEGVDEQILQELKQSWDRRLRETKVLDPPEAKDPAGASSAASATVSSVATPNSSNNGGGSGNSRARKGPEPQMMAAGQTPRSWPPHPGGLVQVDGPNDSSDEDEDDDIDNDDDRDDPEDEEKDEENEGEDDQPLGSSDDVSDEDPEELFETEHVVVCQYDKITRSRNKWKFHLKDGIMNIKQRDYVFQKAIGDAEWTSFLPPKVE